MGPPRDTVECVACKADQPGQAAEARGLVRKSCKVDSMTKENQEKRL